MQFKQIIPFLLILFALCACNPSQQNVDKLKGEWQILFYQSDTTIIQPDSVPQFLSFQPCEDAYTATCKLWFKYLDLNPTTPDSAKLNFTIKDDEIAFIDANINIPNFTKVFKQQRFFIRALNQQELQLERFADSLLIQANRL